MKILIFVFIVLNLFAPLFGQLAYQRGFYESGYQAAGYSPFPAYGGHPFGGGLTNQYAGAFSNPLGAGFGSPFGGLGAQRPRSHVHYHVGDSHGHGGLDGGRGTPITTRDVGSAAVGFVLGRLLNRN